MKTKHLFPVLLAAATVAATTSTRAQTAGYIQASPQATIRGGTSADLDMTEGYNSGATTDGRISVKFSTSLGTARKHYVKVSLPAGQNPNTNGPLWVQYSTGPTSQRQDIQVWSLNQDYPGFTSAITWNTAQANDTNSGSGLMTNGTFTATPYTRFISGNSGGSVYTHTLAGGPWGHMIQGTNIYLVLSSVANLADNGTRFATNGAGGQEFYVGFDNITSGSPPSLGPLADITVAQGQTSVTNAFTVGDPEDGPNGLTPSYFLSSTNALMDATVYFTGSGANRGVYVVGGTQLGTATVEVSIQDANGNLAARSFNLVVQQFNATPVIVAGGETNSIPPTNTLMNAAVSLPFAVSDVESANSSLTVTAAVADYSTAILQSATLNGTGYNTNLSVTVTPQANADGVGVVRLSVSDPNGNTNTVGFCVMVRSNASIVFVDHFDYQASSSKLTDDAPGLWTRRNASPQSVFLRSVTSLLDGVSKVAHVRPNSGGEDLAGRLVATFGPTNRGVLYTKFTATLADLAGDNIITNVNGDSPFFRLSYEGTSTTDFADMVSLQDLSAGAAVGNFTFLLANGATNGPVTNWPSIFSKPTGLGSLTKTIVTRYDIAAGKATLWIDAASESDPSISATDVQDDTPIGYVGLFQERGNGDIYVDDLVVTLAIKPLITGGVPAAGGNVDFDFTAAATDQPSNFAVERAPTVTGAFSGVSSTITSLGGGNFRARIAASDTQGYLRVKRTPISF